MRVETAGPAVERAAAGAARERRRIVGHETRAGTTVFRGGAVAFGLVFVAAGTFVVLAAAGLIEAADSSFHAPRSVVAALGVAFFALPGTALVVHGALGIRRARTLGRARRVHPEAAWRWDRTWGESGEDAPRWQRVLSGLPGTLLFCSIAAALGLFALIADAPLLFQCVAGFFVAISLLPVWELTRRSAEALRYGRTYVRWERCPVFVGERITLAFGVTRDRPTFTRVTFRLRCVEEAFETTRVGGKTRTEVVAYLVHEEVRVLDGTERTPRPHGDALLEFSLPAGLPGNALDRDAPTYWELDVLGEAPGLDYRMRFLLPVYGKAD